MLPQGGLRLNLADDKTLAAGDGLSYTAPDGSVAGFRVNRVEGRTIYLAPGVEAPERGTRLSRSLDAAREKILAREDTATRSILIDISLRPTPDGRLVAEAADRARGIVVSVASADSFTDKASTPQEGAARGGLTRWATPAIALVGFPDV